MICRRRPRIYKGIWRDVLNGVLFSKCPQDEYVKTFEEKVAKYVGAKYAIATCTGRNALELLLMAMDLKQGDEVILPAYTLKDLIFLIIGMGLKPVLVDIEPDTFNIDPKLIEEKITEKTRVIVATHLFGLPCNMDRILEIAKKNNLRVIEDCAHAFGAKYKGKMVGVIGDGGFYSFQLIKLLNTFGGGMVVTNDKKIATYVRDAVSTYPSLSKCSLLLKILLSYVEYFITGSSLFMLIAPFFRYKFTTKLISRIYLSFGSHTRIVHFKFSDIQALIGLKQLSFLRRKDSERLYKAEILKNLLKDVKLQNTYDKNVERVMYYFVIKIEKKEDLAKIRKRLSIKGIDAAIKEEITDDCSLLLGGKYPVANQIYNTAIQIPLYEELTLKQIEAIANAVNKICR